jgi:hypothetical protein
MPKKWANDSNEEVFFDSEGVHTEYEVVNLIKNEKLAAIRDSEL